MSFLETAQHAARQAAMVLTDNFGKITQTDIIEKRQNDFLTFVDKQAEETILNIIGSQFPDHTFLAEEGGGRQSDSDYKWIIDPLDGTKNFITGIPVFAISIALSHGNDIILGVIFDPLRNEMFYAQQGKGAFLNGEPIKVSPRSVLKDAMLATGFPFRHKTYLHQYMQCFESIFEQISGVRRMGAAAIDLAYVACGRLEGYWELALGPWDMAAGLILVREAGGKVSDFWGREDYLPNEYFLSSNGLIHGSLLEIIRNHFKEYHPIIS